MALTKFFWRATAAFFRRSGGLLTRISKEAYSRTLPTLSAQDRRTLALNEKFRNWHQGRRCFIIGNGPSLRNQDLSPLANEITFAMNAFWKHEIVQLWQPTYYFLSDPILFDRSDSTKEFFAELNDRVQKTTFMVPLSQKSVIEMDQLLPTGSTRFMAFEGEYSGRASDEVDFTGLLPTCETVAQLALMGAIFMGCSPIYLLGLDHNWLANRETADLNFYEGKTLQNHPFVTGKSMYSYDFDMEAMLKVWKFYRRLKAIAEQRGLKIIYATPGGYLDVFERGSYESLFNHKTAVSVTA